MTLGERSHRFFSIEEKTVWQKLLLISAPLLVPIAILAYLLDVEVTRQISFARKELIGLEYLRDTRLLREHLQKHRGLANGYLSGDASLKSAVLAEQVQVENAIRDTEVADQKYGTLLGVSNQWSATKAKWAALKNRVFSLEPVETFDEHTALIADVFSLALDVGEYSNLILDPQTDSHFIQDIMVSRLPASGEALAKTRGMGTGIAARKALTADEKTELIVQIGTMQIARQFVGRYLTSAFRYNPSLKPRLEAAGQEYVTATDAYVQLLKMRIIDTEQIDIPPQEFFNQATRAISANFNVFDTCYPVLGELLTARITMMRNRLILASAGVVVALILSIGVGFWVARGINRQLTSLLGTE